MTLVHPDTASQSRGAMRPRFAGISHPPIGGRRESRVRAAPAVSCAIAQEVRTRAYRAEESIRHSLRNGFTAYIALSPVIGFLVTVTGGKLPADLTPASRRQDHTSSPYVSAPFVRSASTSTATRPNVRDDGRRPSEWDGIRESMPLICPPAKA